MNPHTPSAAFLKSVTEAAFSDTLLELAHALLWVGAHFRPAKTNQGWRTPVAGDGKGFPDWVLVRDRIVYAELKKVGEKLRPDQEAWRDWLLVAGQEWYCWTIEDWDEIVRVLR